MSKPNSISGTCPVGVLTETFWYVPSQAGNPLAEEFRVMEVHDILPGMPIAILVSPRDNPKFTNCDVEQAEQDPTGKTVE